MHEKIPYGVFSGEGYFEVCVSEYVDDVRRFITYIGESGPMVLGCL
jgi:hypothetical protein